MPMTAWIITFIFLNIIGNGYAVSTAAKQKYPHQLLTDDYSILNENDLAACTLGMGLTPIFGKNSLGFNYWQCFSREQLSITLRDTGLIDTDGDRIDPMGYIEITATDNNRTIHKYQMRRSWPVKYFQKDFIQWRKLMKGEKYVCLEGSFVDHKYKIENGEEQEVYGWIFNELKTKKGCAAYLNQYIFIH